jgi:hypothetical protein
MAAFYGDHCEFEEEESYLLLFILVALFALLCCISLIVLLVMKRRKDNAITFLVETLDKENGHPVTIEVCPARDRADPQAKQTLKPEPPTNTPLQPQLRQMEMQKTDTVADLMEQIKEREGIPILEQRLFVVGTDDILKMGDKLPDAGLSDGCTIKFLQVHHVFRPI